MSFRRLEKKLTFFDVFAISTGAMFSSGFFLLPGIAFAQAGSAVILAYLLAGFLIVPAMLSKAELSTAMPRAGGTYFFLDRALGPMAGTVGGLGTWMAMVLKTAFAFIGVGAYLGLFFDLPIVSVAVGLTAAFTLVNVIGAKETSGLQRILVSALVGILAMFTVGGLIEIFFTGGGPGGTTRDVLAGIADIDSAGLLATIGLVFVSYAGLTKVSSVAEEVQAPERAIPYGMILSLLVATTVYVLGVFIMVVVIEPEALRGDLTPVATAGEAAMGWLPGSQTAVVLIVIAALAAFLSTGNAGIMSASRYLLAMGRDSLLPRRFSSIGRFGTPTLGIALTSLVIITCVTVLDVASLAKLASAFQLLMFSLVNIAVIVMRESRIAGYDPPYRSPLYPWMQIAGAVIPLILIGELGHLAIIFTGGVVAACLCWYAWYARSRIKRAGAVLHWFERMGRGRWQGLDDELRAILQERGARDGDAFDILVRTAPRIDMPGETTLSAVIDRAAEVLSSEMPVTSAWLAERLKQGTLVGQTPCTGHIAIPHMRVAGLDEPRLVVVRSPTGIPVPIDDVASDAPRSVPIRCFFFLISPEDDPARHLRLLAGIADWVTQGHADADDLAASVERVSADQTAESEAAGPDSSVRVEHAS